MRSWLVTLLAAAVCGSAAAPAYASGNLLMNPGAETGPGGTAETDVHAPPGWATTGAFTATQYGATGFPTSVQSTEYGGGTNFFAGGNAASSSATQTADVAGVAAYVDQGGVTATLSGLLGGYQNQADAMTATATFRDAGNAPLGSGAQIGPVTAADRGNTTELLARNAVVAVPVGTRTIEITLTATRVDGVSNDGYADNVSLTLSTPDVPTGGGSGAATSTYLSCNRGADPGSPWTCYASVGEGSPGGTLAFSSSRGGNFDPAACTLAAAPSRPSSSTCTTIFTPGATGTTLTAAYSGDPTHAASSGAFTIKGQGDVLFCGADPLPACPTGSRPAQVCVSAWVGDCDGKLPQPDPLQVCVSSVQSCTGFGGSKPAKPGTIDLNGLPAAVSETVSCGGKTGKSAQLSPGVLPGSCPIGIGVIVYSTITDRKEYDAAAARFKTLLDSERHSGGMFGLGGITTTLDSIFRLAHFQNAAFAKQVRAQIEKATDSMFACLAMPGNDGQLCQPAPGDAPDCGLAFGFPTPTGNTQSKTDQRTCQDVVLVWTNALSSVKASMLKLKAQAGVDKPFKDTGNRLLAAAAKPRRTFTLLYAGSASISRGKHKAVKLKLAKGAKARLRKLRAAGPRASGQLLVVRGRIPGLAPLTATKTVHLILR